jgi:hypothetical protein
MNFTIRNATLDDIEAIMRAEQHWPEDQRSSEDKFASRINIFPQGFFLTEIDNEVVGVSTSTLKTYDPDNLSPFESWNQCTNGGYLYPLTDIEDYNALFIVSNGIMKQARRTGIREAVICSHLSLAKKLGMQYTVTGAMMPGYDAYCAKHGDIPITEYAFLERDDRIVDPTLNKLSTLGLKLPDSRHIISNYYQS